MADIDSRLFFFFYIENLFLNSIAFMSTSFSQYLLIWKNKKQHNDRTDGRHQSGTCIL